MRIVASARRRALRVLAAAALAGPLAELAGSPVGAAPDVVLDYHLYVGSLHALTLEVRLAEADERYALAFAARTVPPLSRLADVVFEAAVGGRLRADGPAPEAFRSTTRWGAVERGLRLTYAGATPEVEPLKGGADGRPPVSAAERRGTVDPLTGAFDVLADGCDSEAAVFDGRRRYDLAGAAHGPAELPASRRGRFAGRARLCRVAIAPRAGFDPGPGFRDRVPEAVDVWLATPVAGAPPVPLRAAAELGPVRLVLYLVDLRLAARGEGGADQTRVATD